MVYTIGCYTAPYMTLKLIVANIFMADENDIFCYIFWIMVAPIHVADLWKTSIHPPPPPHNDMNPL